MSVARFRSGGDGGSFAIGTRPRVADGRRRRGRRRRADSARKPRRAPIENLKANPRNPRRDFHRSRTRRADRLDQGARHHPADRGARGAASASNFEIIAGERRWRAAQRAGLHDVPIAMVDATDVQSLEFAIIENVQRADLNPIEEAAGYVALMEQCNHTQDEVAQIVGKSRPHVANMVRLLKLPEPVKALVRRGQIVGRSRAAARRPCQRADRLPRWRSTRATACASSKSGCARKRAGPATRLSMPSRRKSAVRRQRTPTPARLSGGCPMCSDWMWQSINAVKAVRCILNIAIWISWTRC